MALISCSVSLSGHFGFFKLLINLVDGKLRQTAADELTFETDCTIILADDVRESEVIKAA